MAADTKIEWCDRTFNPWRGCTKVSAGCANCYAETFSGRNPKVLGVWGPNGTRVVAAESQWREPLKWNKEAARLGVRHRVFCASLADVFEDWHGNVVAANGNPLWWCHGSLSNSPLPATGLEVGCRMAVMQDIRERLFELIEDTPNLDWLLLTKRPQNLKDMLPTLWLTDRMPANVWLGTSVENQAAADARIPHLLKVPAAVRFLSCEPLLSEVNLKRWLWAFDAVASCDIGAQIETPTGDLGWVIVGGESGPGARPMQVEWARSLVQQCKAAGVACFVKQLGAVPVNSSGRRVGPYDAEEGAFPRCPRCGHFDFGPCGDGTLLCNGCDSAWSGLRDAKGGDLKEWPADLRVREFPAAVPS